MPSLVTVFADGGYAGWVVVSVRQTLTSWWVVKRTFAWLVRCRGLDHDYKRSGRPPN